MGITSRIAINVISMLQCMPPRVLLIGPSRAPSFLSSYEPSKDSTVPEPEGALLVHRPHESVWGRLLLSTNQAYEGNRSEINTNYVVVLGKPTIRHEETSINLPHILFQEKKEG